MKIELTSNQRRALRASAHNLNPVVVIGQNGLSESVMREIAISLDAHELIKVRAVSDERETRNTWLETICDQLDAAPVQHLGKLLIIYRPHPEKPKVKLS